MTASTAGLSPETCDEGLLGSVSRFEPENARRPVNSSYNTNPSANKSLRTVTPRPASCSGD